MARYRLVIEYHGGPFVGWQRQDNGRSVQQAVEEALAAVEPGAPRVQGAGRTDAGVHALGQAAHVDLERDWEPERLAAALNSHLAREPVVVLEAARAAPRFHARFDAVARTYLYRIVIRGQRPTFERGLAWWRPYDLDADAMAAGGRALVGRHDFTTFRSSQCQANSPVRTLDELAVARRGTGVEVRATARSFLQHQVRSMVGTLERVGAGRLAPDAVREALHARDRRACGPVAPPEGLYLVEVRYP